MPSPAAAGIVLLPLTFSLTSFTQFENISTLSAPFIFVTSILMVTKIPTYSLKRIVIQKHYAIFLLLGIGIYLSMIIFFTFEILFLTGLVYILLIPISFFHYRYKNKMTISGIKEDEDTDEVL